MKVQMLREQNTMEQEGYELLLLSMSLLFSLNASALDLGVHVGTKDCKQDERMLLVVVILVHCGYI